MAEKRRFVIWHLPTRKKPCLMVTEGNTATKIASFNNEESAQMFAEVLGNIIDEIYAKYYEAR